MVNQILLVDDDPDDQFFFRDALKEMDSLVQCNVAGNGKEALEKLATAPLPDLIFMDLNMPIMNGFDCLAEIKRNENLKQIPVVIFTTTSDAAAIKQVHSLGAAAFLKKPNDFAILLKKIHQLLKTDFSKRDPEQSFSMEEFTI